MGRYYNTNNHDGKFGFAVQPSDDPAIFGMEEQEPTEINYYLDASEENIEEVKRVLDEQYDILGIAKEDRLYELEDEQQLWDLLDKYHDKNYHRFDKEKDKGIPYGDKEWEEGAYPNNGNIALAENRVELGLFILDDLNKDGYCELTAEI